jgi:hypothetical protein
MEDVITDIEEKPGHTLSTPTCTRCGQTDTASVIHDEWLDGYYTTETTVKGTCTIPEVTRDTCTLCGTKRTNTGTVTGHNYGYTRTENDGTLVYTCENCKNEDTRNPQVVALAFSQYINTNTSEKTGGYIYDINVDGIINAKDYSKINKAVDLAKAYN